MSDWKFTLDMFGMSTVNGLACMEIAQAQLDKWLASATMVYREKYGDWHLGPEQTNYDTHRALLIKIERLVECTHPKEKINAQENAYNIVEYHCQCGARVEPTEFKEVTE